MEELKNIVKAFSEVDESKITKIEEICKGAAQFVINSQMYIVCDEDGAETILSEFRDASREAARKDIPEVYHEYFDFDEFAEDTWQTLYDVYDVVNEVTENGKLYFVCLV